MFSSFLIWVGQSIWRGERGERRDWRMEEEEI